MLSPRRRDSMVPMPIVKRSPFPIRGVATLAALWLAWCIPGRTHRRARQELATRRAVRRLREDVRRTSAVSPSLPITPSGVAGHPSNG